MSNYLPEVIRRANERKSKRRKDIVERRREAEQKHFEIE